MIPIKFRCLTRMNRTPIDTRSSGSRTARSSLGLKGDRSILSSHSQIFHRLFGLPDLYHGEIMMGCPVIYLRDSSSQFIHVDDALPAITSPSRGDRGRSATNHSALLVPRSYSCDCYCFDFILCLSTKYPNRNWRQSAIDKPKPRFPSTLESFDDPTRALAHEHRMDVVEVIHLAHDTECFEILPCVLYYCTCPPMSTIHQDGGLHLLLW
ncbi:hypothetical protein BV22DRAFT_913853 [Leucogyrophana mollusca]|uniref:Uncharacterized protein n=1 Tax=Leucogyrophana mollusca TaxID=85980 RepID=A0ACB8AYH1_9AGAM|nr:hypothetical protein BV22DRAFT_913853 [Leucogyrophana mollusca]